MPPLLLFATRNPYKVQLFSPIFAVHGIGCVTLADAGVQHRDLHESGSTPEENALLKARAYHSPTWPLVFADDAALEIDALGGEPGVQARRWNGHLSDDVEDAAWLAYLLQRLEGIPLPLRTARYVAAWAVITPDGREYIRRFCRGFAIAERPLRPIRAGSPMSAVEIQLDEDAANVRAQIAAEWERWGMLREISRWMPSTGVPMLREPWTRHPQEHDIGSKL
jgi:inosine/xanthosine triphosphate pyrophosphatase family protein